MPECACGNRTTARDAHSQGARLKWHECGACGRCDRFELIIGAKGGRQVVERGQTARRIFRDDRLLEQARARASSRAGHG